MENKIEIKSAKIKNGRFLYVVYDQTTETGVDSIKKDRDLPMHDDCTTAFLNLVAHFALICEQFKKNKEIKDMIINGVELDSESELLKEFSVSEFRLGGKAENESIQILGERFLKAGPLSLSSPKLKWDDKDYEFISELAIAIDDVKAEVHAYLNGKHAPLPQQSLEFDESFDEEDSAKNNAGENFKKLKKDLKKKGVKIEVSTSSDAA